MHPRRRFTRHAGHDPRRQQMAPQPNAQPGITPQQRFTQQHPGQNQGSYLGAPQRFSSQMIPAPESPKAPPQAPPPQPPPPEVPWWQKPERGGGGDGTGPIMPPRPGVVHQPPQGGGPIPEIPDYRARARYRPQMQKRGRFNVRDSGWGDRGQFSNQQTMRIKEWLAAHGYDRRGAWGDDPMGREGDYFQRAFNRAYDDPRFQRFANRQGIADSRQYRTPQLHPLPQQIPQPQLPVDPGMAEERIINDPLYGDPNNLQPGLSPNAGQPQDDSMFEMPDAFLDERGNPTSQAQAMAKEYARKARAGLPVSAEFMGVAKGLEQELAAALLQNGIARDQIPATLNLLKSRLATQHGIDETELDENLAAKGIYGEGVGTILGDRLDSGYRRQWEDNLSGASSQFGQLAGSDAEAKAAFQKALQEAAYNYRGELMENPTSAVDTSNRSRVRKRGKKKSGRTRGNK